MIKMDGTLSGGRLPAHIDTISGPLPRVPTEPDIYLKI